MTRFARSCLAVAAFAFAAPGHGALISATSDDGDHANLGCLFNGVGSSAECDAAVGSVPADGWIESGPALNPNAAYQTPGYFRFTADPNPTASFVVSIAGYADSNDFGLFERGNTANRVSLLAGNGSDPSTTIHRMGPDTIYVNGAAYSGFGASFGLYLEGPGGLFFSDASLNAGGHTQMVAFEGQNRREADFHGFGGGTWSSDHWLLAWEDIAYPASDGDFNDMVVSLSPVERVVPAPLSLTLFGAGLLGLGAVTGRARR